MVAEQNVVKLRERKIRIEMLISYYRQMGERERGFAEELEHRLRAVKEALQWGTASLRC